MSEEQRVPRTYEVYQHYKGGRYLVLGVFSHTEGDESMVGYQELYNPDAKLWIRPLRMWFEKVSCDERHYCGPRFVKLIKA